MKNLAPLLALLTAGVLAGCRTDPGAVRPQEATKYSIENTEKFESMDRPTQDAITCTGLQEHRTADGRLDVVVNVKNREDHRVEVQLRCVFKDDNGFSTGDETPWTTLALDGGATEAVHYTAANKLAHKYTVAARSPR